MMYAFNNRGVCHVEDIMNDWFTGTMNLTSGINYTTELFTSYNIMCGTMIAFRY